MGRFRRWRGATSVVLALTGLGACLYDPDDVCSPNQELSAMGLCVCVAGAFRLDDDGGCVLCGANEVSNGMACVCAEGYARAEEGAPCEPVPAGLGEDCDTQTLPCADPVYDYCYAVEVTFGYCTALCQTSDDCPLDYSCQDDGAVRFCKRPPTGQGLSCQSSADCASYEATFCDTYQTHICLVPDCVVEPDSCHEGWECCDISPLGLDETLCLPEGLCPTD